MKADPDMDPPHEVELKYDVRDAEALLAALEGSALGGVERGPWRRISVEDRYVDTVDGALAQAGYGARLRRMDGRTLVTVKSKAALAEVAPDGGGDHAALHRREEYEAPATVRLDPASWPESPARALVERTIGGQRLRSRFIVRQQRREQDLRASDGAATLSLDIAEVRRQGRRIGEFTALEVESIDGTTVLLERLAEVIDATGLAQPERRSKEAIAHALVEAQPKLRLRVPRQPGVRADDPLSEAGRKVLRLHLARMLAVEAGTRTGADPEDLHKMRVATRRMRAVWRVFDGAYAPKVQKRHVAELRTVARALGAVRDMDVQLEALEGYRTTIDDDPSAALEPLADAWRGRRADARRQLLAHFDSRAYARFVEDYVEFVETPGAGAVEDGATRPMRVRDAAAGRTWHAYEGVRAHDAGLRWADVAALHELRIDGKALRYTLESFREVLPVTSQELIAIVTAMQDHLGELNDAHVAQRMVREWLVASAPWLATATREAAGDYLASREAAVGRLRRTFPRVWRRVSGRPFRRRLAVALAEL